MRQTWLQEKQQDQQDGSQCCQLSTRRELVEEAASSKEESRGIANNKVHQAASGTTEWLGHGSAAQNRSEVIPAAATPHPRATVHLVGQAVHDAVSDSED